MCPPDHAVLVLSNSRLPSDLALAARFEREILKIRGEIDGSGKT
jgi:hypothetical protein